MKRRTPSSWWRYMYFHWHGLSRQHVALCSTDCSTPGRKSWWQNIHILRIFICAFVEQQTSWLTPPIYYILAYMYIYCMSLLMCRWYEVFFSSVLHFPEKKNICKQFVRGSVVLWWSIMRSDWADVEGHRRHHRQRTPQNQEYLYISFINHHVVVSRCVLLFDRCCFTRSPWPMSPNNNNNVYGIILPIQFRDETSIKLLICWMKCMAIKMANTKLMVVWQFCSMFWLQFANANDRIKKIYLYYVYVYERHFCTGRERRACAIYLLAAVFY